MARRRLTFKQQRFVEEYLLDLNATQAAIRAGYSERTARQIGEENLSKPDIAEAIQRAMKSRSEAAGITAESVLKDLRILADMCLGKKSSPKCVVGDGKAVEASVKELNSAGAARALELIGKHLKLDRVRLANLKTDAPLTAQGRAVVEAASTGELSLSDAGALINIITGQTRIIESDELAKRVKSIEEKIDGISKTTS